MPIDQASPLTIRKPNACRKPLVGWEQMRDKDAKREGPKTRVVLLIYNARLTVPGNSLVLTKHADTGKKAANNSTSIP